MRRLIKSSYILTPYPSPLYIPREPVTAPPRNRNTLPPDTHFLTRQYHTTVSALPPVETPGNCGVKNTRNPATKKTPLVPTLVVTASVSVLFVPVVGSVESNTLVDKTGYEALLMSHGVPTEDTLKVGDGGPALNPAHNNSPEHNDIVEENVVSNEVHREPLNTIYISVSDGVTNKNNLNHEKSIALGKGATINSGRAEDRDHKIPD